MIIITEPGPGPVGPGPGAPCGDKDGPGTLGIFDPGPWAVRGPVKPHGPEDEDQA